MNISRTLAGVATVAFVVGTTMLALPAAATNSAPRPAPQVTGTCGVPTVVDAGAPPTQRPPSQLPYLSRTHWNAW